MITPLKAVLVDDERLARKRLRELIAPHPGILVIGEADSVETAAALVEELKPDVIFLDVEMPPSNGFDLLPLLPASPRMPEIVFVTAYEAFAVSAFAVSALDYLLKPIHPERLALTVQKLQTAREARRAPEGGGAEPWTLETRVSLSDGKRQSMVEVREIAAIQALGAYSRVNLCSQPSVLVLRSISEWERRLPTDSFVRIDRSLIMQPRLLRTTEKISRDETLVTLEGIPASFSIGRAATVRLRRHLQERR